MKIIRNKFIPFKGWSGINLFGVLFIRPDTVITPRLIRHEKIHSVQQKELWYTGFFLIYIKEYIKFLFKYGEIFEAYYRIHFEREAYSNENDLYYLETRKPYSYKKY